MRTSRPESVLDRIAPGERLLIDTSVVLAYLTGTEATSQAATDLFDGGIANGRYAAVLSAISVAELLVRPFGRGPGTVATIEGFLRHFGDVRVAEVTYDIAREGARLRAATGLAMPDALIIATAVVERIDRIVTNDVAWRGRLTDHLPDVALLCLADESATRSDGHGRPAG